MNCIAIGLLFSYLTCVCYSENETFVPTKEWQEIKPEHGIPAGLHVRINLETGKKEAKLLDDKEDRKTSSSGLSLVPENSSETPPSTDFKEKKTLSDALKKLVKNSLGLDYSPEKFKQIKKEYKALHMSADDEGMLDSLDGHTELISKQIAEYKSMMKTKNKHANLIKMLYGFYFTVNQYDNADRFIQDGGLDDILLPTIVNNTHTDFRSISMMVLGALTQNNPQAQVSVYERNFGSHLSQILISSTSNKELSTALYALGSLIRGFPLAQKNILPRTGIRALISVFNKDCEIKIIAKALTLISDLIMERELAVAHAGQTFNPLYLELNFEEWLTSYEFCQIVDGTLSLKIYELIDQPNITEYFAQALEVTVPICKPVWSQSPQLRHTLLTVRNRYLHNNLEYDLEVAKLIDKVIGLLFTPTENIKDEL